ncbi:MAG: PAS domain S-box protein [Candidatus Zixiibacteriota bacterium]|nr:MAG: PAS domain S-box protein [candidate division Zixibacteria bacterium]
MMESQHDNQKELLNKIGQLHRRITESDQTPPAAGSAEQQFHQLAELLPQAYFELDLEGNLRFANGHALQLSGYSQEEINRGISGFDMIVPEDRERIRANLPRILNGEKYDDHEYRFLCKDGRIIPVLIYSTPILHNGEAIGIRGILIDISDAKSFERKLRESEERYSLATAAANVGVWDWNVKTG